MYYLFQPTRPARGATANLHKIPQRILYGLRKSICIKNISDRTDRSFQRQTALFAG